jgi:TRAP-type C4-dicarboxylate transport system permease small subunit
MEIFSEIIGWIGAFLVVLAFFLVSTKKIKATSKRYQLLNLFGAIGVGVNVFYQQSWPALVLQIIWALIAVYSLIKMSKNN